jgi:DNA-binding transcriptional MerR regulator
MLTIGGMARLGQVSPRMLRHYDQLGLLSPERVDPVTGYRSYGISQLARLHRLVALRDLGFSLEQIGGVLDKDPQIDELRGMLALRRAQIEQTLDDEQARLRRVDAHLRALERNDEMKTQDIVMKTTDPLRVAALTAVASGFGEDNLGPVFARLGPQLFQYLARVGGQPGMCVAWYEEPVDDGSMSVHVGLDIADQDLAAVGEIEIVELPPIEVASVIHRGSMAGVEAVYEGVVRWIEESGLRLNGLSRELYLEWNDADPAANVTELQLPIAR